MKKHLAIMRRSTIEAILTGRKSIETRFTKFRIVPFGVVERGDLIFMKPPGGEIVGQFRVKKVISFEGIDKDDIKRIFDDYGDRIQTGNSGEDMRYQQDKQNASYGTLIFIADSERFITSPIKIQKRDLRAWVVLN